MLQKLIEKHKRIQIILKMIAEESNKERREFLYAQYADVLISAIKEPLERLIEKEAPVKELRPLSADHAFDLLGLTEKSKAHV